MVRLSVAATPLRMNTVQGRINRQKEAMNGIEVEATVGIRKEGD